MEQELKLIVKPQVDVDVSDGKVQSVTYQPMSENFIKGAKTIDDAMLAMANKAMSVLDSLLQDASHPSVQLQAVKLIKEHFTPRLTVNKL